jgi:type IV pilus assembly protein PilQ
MGSLTRKKKSRILLTVVAAVLVVGTVLMVNLFSPPVLADEDLEQQKLRRLGILGMDAADPAVVEAAREAHTLYSVDVLPNEGDINVALQLSGVPSYDTYVYSGNSLVVDLHNTINLSPTSVFALEASDVVRNVRNSQYRVTPSLISRVVLDLEENATPEIGVEGSNLIISVLRPEIMLLEEPAEMTEEVVEATEEIVEESEAMEEELVVPAETVAVPAIEVETETAEAEIVVVEAETVSEPVIESAVTAEEAPAEIAEEPIEEFLEEEIIEVEVIEMPLEETAPAEMVEEVELMEADAEAEMEEVVEEPAIEEFVEVPAEEVAIEEVELVEADVEAEMEEVVEEPAIEEFVEVPAEEVAIEEIVEEPEAEEMPIAEPLPTVIEEPEPYVPEPIVPVAPAAAALPPVQEETETQDEETPIGQQLVSLTFRDADLAAVLDILARKGNLNILAGKDVKGSVTVRLVDVPLDVALNAILNVNGYGYIKSNNVIRILPLKEIGETVRTITKSFPLSYAASDKAGSILKEFLTANGKIQTDERTNTLIVTDVPSNMDRLAALVPDIDKRVKQVLIEVLIVDSVLGDEADMGVSWALSNNADNSPILGDTAFNDEVGVILPVGADALNVTFRTVMGNLDLTAFIEAMVSESDSKVLANPKILTLNNESAEIEIIEEFPYRDVSETSSGGQLTQITFKDIGTKLEVKPQITHDDHVILYLAPEQNSIAGTTTIGVPIVDTRKAETTLIIKNHQTVVLGGLRENRVVTGVTKVPVLGDLPGVKYIFRSVTSDKRDTELLIFITVHIVEAPELLPEDELKSNELANLPRKPSAAIELIR